MFYAFQLPISTNNPADDEIADRVNLDNVNLIDISHLQVNHRLSTNGIEVIIRCLRRDEVRLFYDALVTVARSNAGYGYDELPTFAYFVKYYIDNCCNIVYETSAPRQSTSSAEADDSRRIIVFSSFGDSLFARDIRSVISYGNVVVIPEHRGKRLAAELLAVHCGLSIDMGYTAVYGETSATNTAFLCTTLALGDIVTDTVPKGMFFPNQGWVDLVTFFTRLVVRYRPKHQLLFAKM